jgi:hypothetical protein
MPVGVGSEESQMEQYRSISEKIQAGLVDVTWLDLVSTPQGD